MQNKITFTAGDYFCILTSDFCIPSNARQLRHSAAPAHLRRLDGIEH